jgi:hypothetical protein
MKCGRYINEIQQKVKASSTRCLFLLHKYFCTRIQRITRRNTEIHFCDTSYVQMASFLSSQSFHERWFEFFILTINSCLNYCSVYIFTAVPVATTISILPPLPTVSKSKSMPTTALAPMLCAFC